MEIPDFSKFEIMALILLLGIVILIALVSLQISGFKKQMKEMQANQDLVAKHINDVRRGGNARLDDKDLI